MLPRSKEHPMSRFTHWFRKFSQTGRSHARKPRRRERSRLEVDALEQRQLLSTTRSLVIPHGLPTPTATALSQQAPTLSVAGSVSGQLSGSSTPQGNPHPLTLPQPDQNGYYQGFPQDRKSVV